MKVAGRVLIVVGGPGSGKDILIRAVKDLGTRHAVIVPKHTTRARRSDDGDEMICSGEPGFDLAGCDVVYKNFEETYGLKTDGIWAGILNGSFQVAVVSNIEAINHLRAVFSDLLLLVFVHSGQHAAEYMTREGDDAYVARRAKGYWDAFELFLQNYNSFDHVLINAADPEDLYDQIFRLIRGYEMGMDRKR